MGYWLFMFAMNTLIPLMMIAFGWGFLYKPPQKINGIYGYRTTMSMKNQDPWAFAHKYCGKIWFRLGWCVLSFSVLLTLLLLGKETQLLDACSGMLCLIQCLILIATIFPTERALKNTFNKDGTRKS